MGSQSGQGASLSQSHIERHTTTHTHTYTYFGVPNPPSVYGFGLWRAGVFLGIHDYAAQSQCLSHPKGWEMPGIHWVIQPWRLSAKQGVSEWVPFFQSLVWPERGPNPQPTSLSADALPLEHQAGRRTWREPALTQGEHAASTQKGPGVIPATLLLWGHSAHHCSTVLIASATRTRRISTHHTALRGRTQTGFQPHVVPPSLDAVPTTPLHLCFSNKVVFGLKRLVELIWLWNCPSGIVSGNSRAAIPSSGWIIQPVNPEDHTVKKLFNLH